MVPAHLFAQAGRRAVYVSNDFGDSNRIDFDGEADSGAWAQAYLRLKPMSAIVDDVRLQRRRATSRIMLFEINDARR
jgi:hypothetical protein